MIRFVDAIKPEELSGKKVLLRVNFDVPVNKQEEITESFRIQSHAETINYLLSAGAKVALVSHLGFLGKFDWLTEQIGEILGQTLTLVPLTELASLPKLFKAGPLLLIDNVRRDPREEDNDPAFAKELAAGFDFYVNDAFAVCHRAHASLVAITKFLPSFGGFLVKKEINFLAEALDAPAEGKIVVLGGAKISTKLPVVKNLLDKAEKIIIGGALANNFFKAQGFKIGSSVVDDSVVLTFLTKQEVQGQPETKIVLPKDIVIFAKGDQEAGRPAPLRDIGFSQLIVDIGPESAEFFAKIIKNAKMVIWNGPMGRFEQEPFMKGTALVAKAVAEAPCSIIGGGDTVAAVTKLGLWGKFDYVSTAGGAMLEFLSGKRLPGLAALGYYD